jgi:copper chaperone NosL
MKNNYVLISSFLFIIILLGCSNKPEPISFGSDSCDYCKMMITESKYASELITSKGKILKFDSIECLAAFCATNSNENDNNTLWVPDFNTDKHFISTNEALFLTASDLKSPMSLNISAFKSQNYLNKIQKKFGGKQLNWKDVVNYVSGKWKL